MARVRDILSIQLLNWIKDRFTLIFDFEVLVRAVEGLKFWAVKGW